MRYFIHLRYRGTHFHGWQRQENAYSIQEEVERALEVLLKEEVALVGCGRTDTGVHAYSYYAHFDTESVLGQKFKYSLNAILSDDISVLDVYKSADDMHARFSAITRTYRYKIHYGKDPFRSDISYQLKNKTRADVDIMNEFCKQLLDVRDFSSFEKKGSDNTNSNCQLDYAQWTEIDRGVQLDVTANRFLRNMVRAIVGTSLMVGYGKRDIKSVMQDVYDKKQLHLSMTAPACGLHLWDVKYPENAWEEL